MLMFRRSLIVWKLSAVFIAIIILVFIISGYIDILVDEHYALASARELCRFNSTTIRQSIEKPLMSRDNAAVKELIDNLAKDNPIYKSLQLVSHSGEVVVSPFDSRRKKLTQDSRSCQICHCSDNPLEGAALANHEEIVELPDGSRVVSVITPILNEQACSTADCHAHADSPPVLGFLQTDYSLSGVDALTSARSLQTAIAVLAAIGLGTLGTWLMVGRILGRPIRTLVRGMKKIADGDLSFRFAVRRNDEFAIVSESFNDMTSKLEESLSDLRRTGEYLNGIVENSADIIITVNTSGLIETFNKGAEDVLEYDRSEVIGRKIEGLFADPHDRNVAIEQLQRSDNVVNFETRFLTKYGDVRTVLLTLSRLRSRDGTPIGTFGISKDLTTEKKLQQQLIQSERFTAIGQSFTGLQHSMKNMLNALKGGSYMVKTGIKKDDKELLSDGWEMVEEGIVAITELSKDMLKYMKDWEPEFAWASVGGIIDKIDNVVARTASDKGVEFRTLVLPELPDVYCDANLIHSAIMDIVSNALEACQSKEYEDGESPHIDLATMYYAASEEVAIEVRDNGPGIPDHVKNNIFTPFFSTKKNKGTGLGLALTSRIVNLHGGAIRVDSDGGHGAAFYIHLPVAGPNKNKEVNDGKESDDHR